MEYHDRLHAIREDTVQAVLSTAYWLFLEHGIEDVSLADVARTAKIAPTSLYRYFGNKRNLVMQCGVLFWRQAMLKLDPTHSVPGYDKKSGYEQALALLRVFIRAYEEYPSHLRFLRDFDLFLERSHAAPAELTAYDEALSAWKTLAGNALHKGWADGSIRRDLDFELFYYSITHALLVLAQRLASQPCLVDSDLREPPRRQLEMLVALAGAYLTPNASCA